jgi:hypothetical protein
MDVPESLCLSHLSTDVDTEMQKLGYADAVDFGQCYGDEVFEGQETQKE